MQAVMDKVTQAWRILAGDKADLVGTFGSSPAGSGSESESGGGGCALGPLESWQMQGVYT